MRAFTLAAAILAGSFTLTSAIPVGQLASRGDSECCCCDISLEAIVCTTQNSADGCFCPAVVCPADAPTLRGVARRAEPVVPSDPYMSPPFMPQPEVAARQVQQVEPVVPSDPFLSPPFMPQPEVAARQVQQVEPVVPNDPFLSPPFMPEPEVAPKQAEKVVEKTQCCCCDIMRGANVCSLRAADECYCAAVQCPAGAPTVWE